jgi:hypothetical protein
MLIDELARPAVSLLEHAKSSPPGGWVTVTEMRLQ